jgi:hypothetical protein
MLRDVAASYRACSEHLSVLARPSGVALWWAVLRQIRGRIRGKIGRLTATNPVGSLPL